MSAIQVIIRPSVCQSTLFVLRTQKRKIIYEKTNISVNVPKTYIVWCAFLSIQCYA